MAFRVLPAFAAVLGMALLLVACQPPNPPVTSVEDIASPPAAFEPPASPTTSVQPAAVGANTPEPAPASPTAVAQPLATATPRAVSQALATAIPQPAATPVSPAATPASAAPSPTAAAVAPPPSTTALTRLEGEDLARGQFDNLVFAEGRLQLARRPDGSFHAAGTATSPEIASTMAFDNAVLSWNGLAPRDTALRFELRVRTGTQWSPWFVMGSWSQEGGASQKAQSNSWGEVDVDTLELLRPATAWQYRVTFSSGDPRATPALGLLSLVHADLARPLAGPPIRPLGTQAVDLPVPAYTQLAEDAAIAREICSPTSLTMVLNYYGQNKRVVDVAQAVRDRGNGIFGNWPLNTAYAGQLGFEAYVDRFYSADQLRATLASAIPPIISIRFQPGELSNSPIPSTTGHLIVVRGFTADGNIVVNDPIAPSASEVRRVYKRAELENIWLRAGGVVYVVRRLAGQT